MPEVFHFKSFHFQTCSAMARLPSTLGGIRDVGQSRQIARVERSLAAYLQNRKTTAPITDFVSQII